MRGKSGNVSEVWQKVFDDLGLDLVVVRKENKDGSSSRSDH